MKFEVEQQTITILTIMVLYICVCLTYAAWKVYCTFFNMGFGYVGAYITGGFILMAIGFIFVGLAGVFLYDMPIEERIYFSMAGRGIQSIASLLLVLGFVRYHEWSTGNFSRTHRSFQRRGNPTFGKSATLISAWLSVLFRRNPRI